MLDNSRRAELGRVAVDVGCAERGRDDERSAATEAVANVLHHLAAIGEAEPELILSSAATHFFAERQGVWTPVEHDEGVFYLESGGERLGPCSREEAYPEADRLNGLSSGGRDE
jgi:hypothetical protein